jgi:four helix bundle protein
MKDFRTLKVWQKSHQLTLSIYALTKEFPKEELFGVTSQLRRAAGSIPTNLAEGCGRGSEKDFTRFIQISMGSACETEYLLQLCNDIDMIDPTDYQIYSEQICEIKKMLVALIKAIRE